jgi:hypothetical protein
VIRRHSLGSAVALQPAGAVNGIATLRVDLRALADAAVQAYGPSANYDRADYERFLAEAKRQQLGRVPSTRIRNFVLGVISDVASAITRAAVLSEVNIRSEAERAENHRVQAELVGAARLMLDAATSSLRSIEPQRAATSGLGAAPAVPVALIALVAAAYAIVGVTAIVMIGLVYDAWQRMRHARTAAATICAAAQPPCTPEQYARMVQQLALGPLDRLAEGGAAAAQDIGKSIGIAVAIGGGVVALLGAAYFLFGTAAGHRTVEGARKATR